MRHGSLFSGIGGAELAASWMGWENVFHCEINKYNLKLLKQHFPESISYEDIKTTEFIQHRGRIDILTGGFPCQSFSVAGTRAGTNDNRYLWPEMYRAVREIQPRWVVGENVPGLISWSKGLVFEQVQTDLEAAGFEVFPPFVLPACGLDADHRRERVWIVAHAAENGSGDVFGKNAKSSKRETFPPTQRIPALRNEYSLLAANSRDVNGLPEELDAIGSFGNAWVPQLALQIFKAIEQYEKHEQEKK